MASTDAFLDELVRASADLDRLIADRTVSPPSHTRHERHVTQAEELAARLKRAGRGPGRQDPAGTSPVNPPAYVSPCGKKAGW